MKNFIQDGGTVTAIAPTGGATSGVGVVTGNLFGVAKSTQPAGASVELATEGVFDLPKLGTAVITAGAKVSWDATNKYINVPGTGLYPVGVALLAAGSGASIVRVRLDGIGTAAA